MGPLTQCWFTAAPSNITMVMIAIFVSRLLGIFVTGYQSTARINSYTLSRETSPSISKWYLMIIGMICQ